MAEQHERRRNGQLLDDVSTYPITTEDRALYDQAQQALSQLSVPTLHRKSNLHERMFIVNFDGTGNDAINDPEHMTNVGAFNKQLETLSKIDPHIRTSYVEGPGTQGSFLVRLADGVRGYTYDARLEKMYAQFIDQAQRWLEEDPQAQIRIIATGFSRGAEQAAGFTRMVHERGIQDRFGMRVDPQVIGPDIVTYTNPPLVPPGQVLQAVALFDPVGTGLPQERDRRLPPSVVSGLQIVARDERRNAFPSSQIIPQGLSPDGRFLGVTVPGAHSDIGGGYHLNGLSALNGNLMTDFINALSEKPLLQKQPEPQDPSAYVVHRSEEHLAFYGTSVFEREGFRDSMGAQVSPPHCRMVEVCAPPEPLDPALAGMVGPRVPVTIAPLPTLSGPVVDRALAPASVIAPPLAAPAVDVIKPAPGADAFRHGERRDFDRQRYLEVGNIPVPLTFFAEPETTPASSLVPVHRQERPDRAHELTLLREITLVNERTARELARTSVRAYDQELAPQRAAVRTQEPQRDAPMVELARTQASTEAPRRLQPSVPFAGALDAPFRNLRKRDAFEQRADHRGDAPADISPRHRPDPAPITLAEPAAMQRDDPRHPLHRHHALYATLQERMPYASEERLVQFTAACHTAGITAQNFYRVIPLEAAEEAWFERSWPPGPFAKVDLNAPMPTPLQALQQVEQFDRQEAIRQAAFEAEWAQVQQNQRYGPLQGGPAL